MNAPPGIHPAEETLIAFGMGKADETTSSAVVRHLEGCSECRSRVASLSADSFVDRLQTAKGPGNTSLPNRPLPTLDHNITTSHSHSFLPRELADCGQYEDIRELGKGGMGIVYVARNKLMGREEVLKVVNKSMLERPGAVERFLREIQSAAKLQHPNVVAAYSAMQMGELLVFAMEYVPGQDLAQVVRGADRPVPIPNACYYAYQTALGLQHAYEKGMVHRDIKPSNLILTKDGKKSLVKILDFGLAKVSSEKGFDGGLTGEGRMLGTPDFMAPEQALDAAKADIRADIYSLGCTLYFLLVGRPPFAANSLLELLQHHQGKLATPVNLLRPDVPVELDMVVAQMMGKDPRKRFQTPAEVAKVLLPFVKPGTAAKPGAKPDVSADALQEVSPGLGKTATASSAPSQLAVKAKRPEIELEVVPVPGSHSVTPVTNQASVDTWENVAKSSKTAHAGGVRRSSVGNAVAAGVVLVLLTLLLAAIVLRVETPNGTLLVEINDPAVEARIKSGQLILTDPDGKILYTLAPGERDKQIDAGPYKIRVEGADGLVLDTPEFTLKKGDKVIVKVTMEQKALAKRGPSVPTSKTDVTKKESSEPDVAKKDPIEPQVAKNDPIKTDVAKKEDPSKHYLYDLQEFDWVVNDNLKKGDIRQAIIVNGEKYQKGLFMHPRDRGNGSGKYKLDGLNASVFEAKIALNDSVAGSESPLTFLVLGDDKVLWTSKPVKVSRETQDCQVDVRGVHVLELRVVCSGRHGGAHAVWLDPYLLSSKKEMQKAGGESPQASPKLQAVLLPTPPPSAALKALSRNQIPPEALALAGNGDPNKAPASLVGLLGKVVPIHTEGVLGLAYSPDGHWLASGSADKTIILRDAATGEVKRILKGHTGVVSAVAFSKDSKNLVSASYDGTIKLWSVERQGEPKTIRPDLPEIWSMATSPDGRFLAAGGSDRPIILWKWGQWDKPVNLPALTGRVQSLSFSPNGELLASSWDGVVRFYKTTDGTATQTWPADRSSQFLAFHRDGKWLATTGDHVKIWEVATGQLLGTTNDSAARTNTLALHPKENLVYVCVGGGLGGFTYDLPNLKRPQGNWWSWVFREPNGISVASYSPNGKFLAFGTDNGGVHVWDYSKVAGGNSTPRTTPPGEKQLPKRGHSHFINTISVGSDGRTVLSGGDDNALRQWDISRPIESKLIEKNELLLNHVALSPDRKRYVTSASYMDFDNLRRGDVWDGATGKLLFSVDPRFHGYSVVFSPDGKLLAGCGRGRGDECLILWDANTGKQMYRFPKMGVCLDRPAFSRDSKRVASATTDTKNVKVWDVVRGEEAASWIDNKPMCAVALSEDGRFVAAGHHDGTISLWEVNKTGKKKRTWEGHSGSITRLMFTPDGTTVISSSSDGTIRLWNPEAAQSREIIPLGPTNRPLTFDLDPSGKYLFAAGHFPVIFILRLPESVDQAAATQPPN